MRNNKGMAFVFVLFITFAIFTFIAAVWKMGINDLLLSKKYNYESKSHFLAESGIYYSGSVIFNNSTPPTAITVNNPFNEYIKSHSYNITINKQGQDYLVISEGTYNGAKTVVQALVTISNGGIVYRQMKLR